MQDHFCCISPYPRGRCGFFYCYSMHQWEVSSLKKLCSLSSVSLYTYRVWCDSEIHHLRFQWRKQTFSIDSPWGRCGNVSGVRPQDADPLVGIEQRPPAWRTKTESRYSHIVPPARARAVCAESGLACRFPPRGVLRFGLGDTAFFFFLIFLI